MAGHGFDSSNSSDKDRGEKYDEIRTVLEER